MARNGGVAAEREGGDRLLKLVQSIAITPADARSTAAKYRRQAERPGHFEDEIREAVAKKIVARYAKLAGMSGGLTSLSSIFPGVGTAIAAVGGAVADTAVVMKLQVGMCMCLAALFDYDVEKEDARYLVFLIAATGALEGIGTGGAVRVGSRAGVALLRTYLRGAALQAVKQLFRRVGLVFTRKALEKSLPFGIGVGVSASLNYALTRYVGAQAIEWFSLDTEESSRRPRARARTRAR